jgi:CMP-N-acetylneuraminic acid synthetase
MQAIAIIMARAGSSMPGKHLRRVGEQCVLQHQINLCQRAYLVSETVLSTDCPDLTRVARAMGIQVFQRPAFLATEDCDWLQWWRMLYLHFGEIVKQLRGEGEHVLLVAHGSSMVFDPELPDRMLSRLVSDPRADRAWTVMPAERFHPTYSLKRDADGYVRWAEPDKVERRQTFEPRFFPSGTGLWAYYTPLRDKYSPIDFGNVAVIETKQTDAIEIHDEDDVKMANALWIYHERLKQACLDRCRPVAAA